MKETRGKNTRSVKILILLSILLTLSGTAAIASADDEIPPVPNVFHGTVALNGEWAEVGTTIKAYVGDDPNPGGEFEVEVNAWYYIGVEGSESDEGKTITFKVNGVAVDQTAVWNASTTPLPSQRLNLGDPPTSPPPAPPSTDDRSNGGVGGFGSPAATPVEAGTPVSEEGATPTPALTLTPAAQATPALAEEESGAEPKNGILPGFEAMFAIAGLLAVVYLVRRRR